jgi:hypothetical protein
LRNRICLFWLHWKNFTWQHWMFFHLFTLCSAHVRALVIVLVTVPMNELENWRFVWFWNKTVVGVSLTRTANLLGVSRATVSKVMSTYTNHGKTISVKRTSGQKSTLTERGRCILRGIFSKNNRTTAAQVTAELNMY